MFIGSIRVENKVFLAPMAGVTDKVFRMLCREQGCGLVYTEMVSAKGLYYGSGRTADLLDTHLDKGPVGVQIFGSDPAIMAQMAEKICQYEIDLIDINMGCPTPKIVKNGEGSALMKNPKLAGEIVKEVVKASSKPVTVKMRSGWDDDSINAVDLAMIVEDAGATAVTLHGRTRGQFYSGKADWGIIKKVKSKLTIPLIGNGDIFSAKAASDILDQTGCDAIMVARGAQGNPWIFREIGSYLNKEEIISPPGHEEIISTALRHLRLLAEDKDERIAVNEMRKHIAWYIKGLKNAAGIKRTINKSGSLAEIEDVLGAYLNELDNGIESQIK
ncbi:MAG TPA: tRNA dihydrouridine synthase DusB [Bacillota bacterium]|nr:tRNA dihydrouridine synthase DusB [Bacillota bacterium]